MLHCSVCAVRLSQLGVARFTKKYPAVLDALLRTMLEVVVKFQRAITGCAAMHVASRDTSATQCLVCRLRPNANRS